MANTTHTAKHTPGPWEVTGPHSREVITTNPSTYKPCMTIAKVGGYWDGEAQANASLIAAAPAMYADGKVLCGLVRDFMNDNRLYDGQVIQAIHNLETALAQAEGKQ